MNWTEIRLEGESGERSESRSDLDLHVVIRCRPTTVHSASRARVRRVGSDAAYEGLLLRMSVTLSQAFRRLDLDVIIMRVNNYR